MKNNDFDNSKAYKTVNFWTDFVRKNETHFWSEIQQDWWSQCRRDHLRDDLQNPSYSEFLTKVVIDGYKKIRNVDAKHKTTCICIGKVLVMKTTSQTVINHYPRI